MIITINIFGILTLILKSKINTSIPQTLIIFLIFFPPSMAITILPIIIILFDIHFSITHLRLILNFLKNISFLPHITLHLPRHINILIINLVIIITIIIGFVATIHIHIYTIMVIRTYTLNDIDV